MHAVADAEIPERHFRVAVADRRACRNRHVLLGNAQRPGVGVNLGDATLDFDLVARFAFLFVELRRRPAHAHRDVNLFEIRHIVERHTRFRAGTREDELDAARGYALQNEASTTVDRCGQLRTGDGDRQTGCARRDAPLAAGAGDPVEDKAVDRGAGIRRHGARGCFGGRRGHRRCGWRR